MKITARSLQIALGSIFLVLGGWTLLLPGVVEQLVLSPEYYAGTRTSALLIGCFGAQAVLCGTVIVASRFTPRTFLVFGLVGSIPFFGFNYYFVFVEPVFNRWMLIDFIGNLGILACGVRGWQLLRAEQPR
ncbi:MAG: hypothetical protein R3E86_05605 [Pseudomonadales bacterium]